MAPTHRHPVHARSLVRVAASAIVALLGASMLTTLTASAAVAVTGTGTDANANARITVSAHAAPFSSEVWLTGVLEPVASGRDCAAQPAMFSYKVGSTSGGFTTAPKGTSRVFTTTVTKPDGDAPFTVDVSVRGGCTGNDGRDPNLELTLTVDPTDLVSYYTEFVAGIAYLGDDPAAVATAYGPAAGVIVELLDITLGESGTPVATTTTAADGSYLLLAPVTTQAQADGDYRIRFRYPTGAVVYYDGQPPSAWRASTSDWESATDIDGPTAWAFTAPDKDAILATATQPSETATTRLCYDADSLSIATFSTDVVAWDAICETDPRFFGADLVAGDTPGGPAGFGFIWFDQGAGEYRITADSHDTQNVDGVLTTTFRDDDIFLIDEEVTVDVIVARTFAGSGTRWVVEVRDSVTGDIVDIPFHFDGDVFNQDGTTWTASAANPDARISDGGMDDSGDAREAILAHRAVADSVIWQTGGIDQQLELLVDGGHLTYYLVVVDYSGCVVGAARTAALAIAENAPTTYAQSLAPSTGDACAATWVAPTIDPTTVGGPFDQTFTVDSTALDWTAGGTVSATGLPAGLALEVLDENVDGVAPRFRIHGIPTTHGSFTIHATATDGNSDTDAVDIVGAVTPPTQSAEIVLGFEVDDSVAGATADVAGTGLSSGSSYEVIVESTPQTVGGGTIGATLVLDDTVIMPSNLDPGWHSITLSGRFYDGSALNRVLWFLIAADGTLADVSPTAPADVPSPDGGLAATGVEIAGPVGFGALLLAAGALVLLRRRRRMTFRRVAVGRLRGDV